MNTISLLALFVITVHSNDVDCLAKNIYFEATVNHTLDRVAVTNVVLSRVKSRNWPSTICGVVYQPSNDPARPWLCQFSWTCDGASDKIKPHDREYFLYLKRLARAIIENHYYFDPTLGSTHYVRCDKNPSWLRKLEFKIRIGSHCYYGYRNTVQEVELP